MSLQITGELYKAFPTKSKTDTFQAREFVLSIPGNYPQLVKFQLVQDKCALLDNYSEGDELTVHFDLRGRKWQPPEGEARYFTNLNAWRLDPVAQQEAQPQPPAEPEPEPEPEFQAETDDLPF